MTIKTLQDIEQALASGKALFIKFSATWCSPCKALKPKWEEAAQQFAEQANFVEFDVDEDDEALCADLRINSVPTLVAFKISTQQFNRLVGNVTMTDLSKFVISNI